MTEPSVEHKSHRIDTKLKWLGVATFFAVVLVLVGLVLNLQIGVSSRDADEMAQCRSLARASVDDTNATFHHFVYVAFQGDQSEYQALKNDPVLGPKALDEAEQKILNGYQARIRQAVIDPEAFLSWCHSQTP